MDKRYTFEDILNLPTYTILVLYKNGLLNHDEMLMIESLVALAED